jgi:hypothetical protein
MPSVTIGVCAKCNNSYIINLDECKIFNNMKIKKNDQNSRDYPIKTWGDWVLHIQTYCPNCRYPAPPLHVVEDLEKLSSK